MNTTLLVILLYTIFIPQIIAGYSMNPKRGFALAHPEFTSDINDVSWYYTYDPCNPMQNSKCVPLSYYGDPISFLDSTYDGFLLIFNEPNNVPPYGGTLTPQEAAIKYLNLKQLYPNAKLIPGNTTVFGLQWLLDFRAEIGTNLPYAWGYHTYMEGFIGPEEAKAYINYAHTQLGNLWITEWADTQCNVDNAEELRTWMNDQPYIERWAWFTNRIRTSPPEEWWPSSWCPTGIRTFDQQIPTAFYFWWVNILNMEKGLY